MGLGGFRLGAARCREQGQPQSFGKGLGCHCGATFHEMWRLQPLAAERSHSVVGLDEQGQQSRGEGKRENPGKGMGTPSQGCAGAARPSSRM